MITSDANDAMNVQTDAIFIGSKGAQEETSDAFESPFGLNAPRIMVSLHDSVNH